MYRMITGTLARTFGAAAIAACMLLPPDGAQASELVMFDQAGCIYCQRWERDIGTIYAKTDEAKKLPLRRINIRDQNKSGITLASPVHYTPTFVVIDNGREVGRITGYSSDDSFWGLLDALAAKLPSPYQSSRI